MNAGNVANLLKNIPNAIIRAQFQQEKMDEITAVLEVEPTLYKQEHEKRLREEFYHKFGPNLKVNIKIVEEIPREKSGKYRMIVNTVESK